MSQSPSQTRPIGSQAQQKGCRASCQRLQPHQALRSTSQKKLSIQNEIGFAAEPGSLTLGKSPPLILGGLLMFCWISWFFRIPAAGRL